MYSVYLCVSMCMNVWICTCAGIYMCVTTNSKLIVLLFFLTVAGVPYEVVVVAFTGIGKGEKNDHTIFFYKELAPTKSPEDVDIKQLSSTSLNVTWTPLTLFEARGFPEYRTILTPLDTNSRRKRQSNDNSTHVMITQDSFIAFTGLRENTDYSVVVGVRTGNSSEFLDGDPISGTNSYLCLYISRAMGNSLYMHSLLSQFNKHSIHKEEFRM